MLRMGRAEPSARRSDASASRKDPAAIWGIPKVSLTFLIFISPPRAAEPSLAHPILILQHGPTAWRELSRGEEKGERF